MPRKRTRTTTEYVDEPEERDISVESDPAEESYAVFMGKWGREGAKVRVYRQTPQGRQYCMLGKPEEIDPEYIRMYHAKQTFAHETGSYEIEVEVNGEVRPPFHILIAPQVNAPGVPETPQAGPMGEILRMMQAQNERLERQLMSQNREPLGNLADALVKIDQLRGGQKQAEVPVDTLLKAIQLGKEMGGSGDSDWTMKLLDVLKDSMPAIQGFLGSMAQRANGNAPLKEAPMNDDAMLQAGLTYLKKKALAQSDPGLYVDIIVDNREELLYEKLIRRILENDFSAFAAIDPEISRPEYEPFFRTIYDGIRSVFIAPNSVEMDTSGTSGNAGNSTGNGKPRKVGGSKS